MYVDDGNGGSFANTDTTDIENKPYLRSHKLIFTDPLLTGKFFRIKIKAINEIGSVTSSLTSIMLADVPSKPSAAPSPDYTGTSSTQIKVTYTVPADDGGSDITSYEL